MLPLEFIATPEASPRCMSGGSLMKFGTESNCSSGADVDCANADGLINTRSPASHVFIIASLRAAVLSDELLVGCSAAPPVYKRLRLQHNRRAKQSGGEEPCSAESRSRWASCLQARRRAPTRSPNSTAASRST